MTGPEHYREAELLLAAVTVAQREVRHAPGTDADKIAGVACLLAEAQVHATLAMAAATAYIPVRDCYAADTTAWAQVTL